MPNKKRHAKARKAELDRYACEIGSIRESLNDAYSQFNNTADPDALDACIFEISALRSRYNTALKHYRQWYY
jgi:hypothetical protein